MKPTIRNKLVAGFCGMMLLMSIVAGIGAYAVFSLRRSAQDATRIGGQLNAIGLEIQVHNLEAQRRVSTYLLGAGISAAPQDRNELLEEANFEIHEMQALAQRAVAIAPTPEKRAKFAKLAESVTHYEEALRKTVQTAGSSAQPAAMAAYSDAAEQLHENAEDGEAAGKDASLASQQEIESTSKSSVSMVLGISLLGFVVGAVASYKLTKAILTPVEHLKTVAENVSLGNLEMAVRRYSEDEIGDLADSFSRMVTAVKFFRSEAEMVNEPGIEPVVGR